MAENQQLMDSVDGVVRISDGYLCDMCGKCDCSNNDQPHGNDQCNGLTCAYVSIATDLALCHECATLVISNSDFANTKNAWLL